MLQQFYNQTIAQNSRETFADIVHHDGLATSHASSISKDKRQWTQENTTPSNTIYECITQIFS